MVQQTSDKQTEPTTSRADSANTCNSPKVNSDICASPAESDRNSCATTSARASAGESEKDNCEQLRRLNADSVRASDSNATSAERLQLQPSSDNEDENEIENENAPADKHGERQLLATARCNNSASRFSARERMTDSHVPTQSTRRYLNGVSKGAGEYANASASANANQHVSFKPNFEQSLYAPSHFVLNGNRRRFQPSFDGCGINRANGTTESLINRFSSLQFDSRSNRARYRTIANANANSFNTAGSGRRTRRPEMLREEISVHPQALVALHIETTGKQDEDLGSDEMQTARISYLIYDISKNKVVDSGSRLVRPQKDERGSSESETATVTEECKTITGLLQDDLLNAQPLEEVLEELHALFERHGLLVTEECESMQSDTANNSNNNNNSENNHEAAESSDSNGEKPMDTSCSNHEANDTANGNGNSNGCANGRASPGSPHQVAYNFVLLTDGPAHLRMVLHPEASAKNIVLKPFWYRYFDLRKEFRKCYKVPAETPLSISRMLELRELAKTESGVYGLRSSLDMSSIIGALIKQGHEFTHPEVVRSFLEPGICYKSEFVDDECVVRARGLPWQSTDQDVAKFFRGLNIAKGGVALCLTKQGRRNGEALVRFDSREFRDLALRRHKHHLKQRYIEVYRAGGRDFVAVAAGRTDEGHIFLQKLTAPDQCIVRMRGLPYTCTAEQILTFFNSGDGNRCEVQLGEEGVLFVHHPDGRATGDAFVLFENEQTATKALAKHKESIGNRYIELFRSTMAEVQQVLNQCHDTLKPGAGAPGAVGALPGGGLFGLPHTQRSCVHLRGLPSGATVADILAFLEEPHAKNIVLQGVHLVYNAQGVPVGEAFIQMNGEAAAKSASLARNGKTLRKHVVEVRQCFPDEMSLLIPSVGLLPTPPMPLIDPAAALQAQLFAACGGPQLAGLVSRPPAFMPQRAPLAVAASHGQPVTNFSPDSSMNSSGSGEMAGKDAAQTPAASVAPVPTNAQQPLMAAPNMLHSNAGVAALAAAMQAPLFYWYPSPPISPQQLPFGGPIPPYYMTSLAAPQVSTVVLRGVPTNVTPQDLLHFFEGIYESTPEIQLAIGMDGRPTGDIYVTFASRVEAERAVTERNRKYLGNKSIEVAL